MCNSQSWSLVLIIQPVVCASQIQDDKLPAGLILQTHNQWQEATLLILGVWGPLGSDGMALEASETQFHKLQLWKQSIGWGGSLQRWKMEIYLY